MEDFYEHAEDIPDDAFKPDGVCSVCGKEGPVITASFGPVLVDTETGDVIEAGTAVEENDLCRACVLLYEETPNLPPEYLEAAYRDKQGDKNG